MRRRLEKSEAAFRTISEVATELDVPQHVLRFWETRFTQVRPLKRGGGRRYYRPEDVNLLKRIRTLLYSDGLTIKGVQKLLRQTSKDDRPSVSLEDAASNEEPTADAGLSRDEASKLLVELTALRDDLRNALQGA
ncbi:MAG: transcriptional regulator [Candidatus Marinimicrobia bacterium]|nr:transcriptional regulator [Candidatus Neomarinimicrobiota bacterium]